MSSHVVIGEPGHLYLLAPDLTPAGAAQVRDSYARFCLRRSAGSMVGGALAGAAVLAAMAGVAGVAGIPGVFAWPLAVVTALVVAVLAGGEITRAFTWAPPGHRLAARLSRSDEPAVTILHGDAGARSTPGAHHTLWQLASLRAGLEAVEAAMGDPAASAIPGAAQRLILARLDLLTLLAELEDVVAQAVDRLPDAVPGTTWAAPRSARPAGTDLAVTTRW